MQKVVKVLAYCSQEFVHTTRIKEMENNFVTVVLEATSKADNKNAEICRCILKFVLILCI